MFLKSLKILSESKIIRKIIFKKGINLIVDETPKENLAATGNNVGKTTVLKLIDFCLGGSSKEIYVDNENKNKIDTTVKDFLENKHVIIELVLTNDFASLESEDIKIERNFLSRKNKICKINGINFSNENDFILKLQELLFPNLQSEKPTFRQVISHNIRYKDNTVNNTLKTLNSFTKDEEYESLYLYLLGCNFKEGNKKEKLLSKKQQEMSYKIRLEKNETKTGYEMALKLIENDIEKLEKKKENIGINENFEKDFSELNELKTKINLESSTLSNLELRKSIILEAKKDLEAEYSDIDTQQLHIIYDQATKLISGIQKTFDQLVDFHNKMIDEKKRFITGDLPDLEKEINLRNKELETLLKEEKELSFNITQKDSFEDIENLINELNDKYRQKGEFENIIKQIKEAEKNIIDYDLELDKIDNDLFSENFKKNLEEKINKFNIYFSEVSKELYNERYILKQDKITNKKNKTFYKFDTLNINMSTGKKQGEILCFDIAYILYADSEKLPCLHFLLNDKKELMHDNQLLKLKNYILNKNIQFVASILKDKLPSELNKREYIILELSQNSKLFGI